MSCASCANAVPFRCVTGASRRTEEASHTPSDSKRSIADIASKYGANIGSDMNDNKWRSLVDVVTAESSKNDIGGTPTVFVDGEQYTSNDFTGFLKGKIDAKKNNNNPQQ